MPKLSKKTGENMFYQARKQASIYNDALRSREAAAEMMEINPGRLNRIESDIIDPYPEEVHLMAKLYNSPHLRNYYCNRCCILGCNVPEAEPSNLDRITVRAMSIMRRLAEIREDLLSITEDGNVNESERPMMRKILSNMEEMNGVTATLRNWIETNLEP